MVSMSDRALLDDLIAKLREMEEQLSMAKLEVTPQSLLASRIQHLTILAHYTRMGLHKMRQAADPPPASGNDEPRREV